MCLLTNEYEPVSLNEPETLPNVPFYQQGPEKEFCQTGQLAMYMKYLQTVDAPSHIKYTKYIDTEYNLIPVFVKW